MVYQFHFKQGFILARYNKKWVDYIRDEKNKVWFDQANKEETKNGGYPTKDADDDRMLVIQRLGSLNVWIEQDILFMMMIITSLMEESMRKEPKEDLF